MGGHDAGRLVTDTTRVLSPEEVDRLTDAFAFLEACQDPPDKMMLDGAMWIFERKTAGGYCVIDDQSPETGLLRAAGVLLLELVGYSVSEDEVY